jgi:excisionase family DNA binding protein
MHKYAWIALLVTRGIEMDERWLTVEDIRQYLNVSKETIYRWIEQKSMPGHRVGRRWMFKQNEVDGWVRSGGASEK